MRGNYWIIYHKTNIEASTLLCFVVKHLRSVRALKKWGKRATASRVSPYTCFVLYHFLRALQENRAQSRLLYLLKIVWGGWARRLAFPFFLASLAMQYSLLLLRKKFHPQAFNWKHFWRFSTFRTKKIRKYHVCFCQHSLTTIDIPFRRQELRTAGVLLKAFLVFFHIWTKNIHIYIISAHFFYDQYSFSSKNCESHAFNFKKVFLVFSSHLGRRMYTCFVCFCQGTLATINVPFWARIANRTRLHSKVVYCWLNEMHELRIERPLTHMASFG